MAFRRQEGDMIIRYTDGRALAVSLSGRIREAKSDEGLEEHDDWQPLLQGP